MDFSDFLKKEEEKNKPKEEEKIRFVGRKRNFVNKKDLPMVVTFNREFDFLKYFYVVEYWAMSQYKINRDDLAMLLFLYSEDYFDIKLFNKYSFVLISKKDHLERYLEEGYIEKINVDPYVIKKPRKNAKETPIDQLYKMTYKARRMIMAIYDRLVMKYEVSENNMTTIMFRPRIMTSKDKKYGSLIKDMNKRREKIVSGEDKRYLRDDVIIKKGGV
jgi:hypothetical protein